MLSTFAHVTGQPHPMHTVSDFVGFALVVSCIALFAYAVVKQYKEKV